MKSQSHQPDSNNTTQDHIRDKDAPRVSFFNSFSDNMPKDVKIMDIIKDISGERWKEQTEQLRNLRKSNLKEYGRQKLTLPFFTMAGTFTKRQKRGFLKSSGYIILDIDGLSLEEVASVRKELEADKHTAISFLSPSGIGLKIAFKVKISNDMECKSAFTAISNYFASEHNIELDQSGKDISRACFVSYDPNVYYNPDADQFIYELTPNNHELTKPIKAPTNKSRIEKYILSVINGELERITAAVSGTGNEALNIAAMKVAQLYHLGLFDKGPLKNHFTRAYLNRGNSYKNTVEASNTFESGWNTGIKTPRDISQGVTYD